MQGKNTDAGDFFMAVTFGANKKKGVWKLGGRIDN